MLAAARQTQSQVDVDSTASIEDLASEVSDVDDSDDDDSTEDEEAAAATKKLSRFRTSVYALLTTLCLGSSVVVHHQHSSFEKKAFGAAFEAEADRVLDGFTLHTKLAALNALAVDVATETALMTNTAVDEPRSQWPQVTLANFESHALSTLELLLATGSSRSNSSIMLLPIVSAAQRSSYEAYTVQHVEDWMGDTVRTEEDPAVFGGRAEEQQQQQEQQAAATTRITRKELNSKTIAPHIFGQDGAVVSGPGPFAPVWQTAPITPATWELVNYDMLAQFPKALMTTVLENRTAAMTQVVAGGIPPSTGSNNNKNQEPVSLLLYPVVDESNVVVAVIAATMTWSQTMLTATTTNNAAAAHHDGHSLDLVLHNACNQTMTFQGFQGSNIDVNFLGHGDLHSNSALQKSVALLDSVDSTLPVPFNSDYCQYTLQVYPSKAMERAFFTFKPLLFSGLVVVVFAFIGALFCVYDSIFEKRQIALTEYATQSNAILSNLFPEQVRERLFNNNDNDNGNDDEEEPLVAVGEDLQAGNNKFHLKSFLTDGGVMNTTSHAKPIADLFPHCTVMFADIAGFTSWSSLRDAPQVFTLLEAVYQAFDVSARKRGVFKVETIGDSYVAVTGLPDPQEDHAVIMGKFARDCKIRFKEVAQKLELSLGPDTGDLCMRFGLHSGPVTAGVLRGEKSRFQLFGDTVNTAARMESTGERDRIQISQQTADLIVNAGLGHWVRPRECLVHAKGKGALQNFWLEPTSKRASMRSSLGSTGSDGSGILNQRQQHLGECAIWGTRSEITDVSQRNKHARLIEYNVDLLTTHLKLIVARRKSLERSVRRGSMCIPARLDAGTLSSAESTVLEEVTEVIRLPSFNPKAFKGHVDVDDIELGPAVLSQLKRYVTVIAAMYRQNPFHNWEHASHVTMSVNKLLQKVVTPGITLRRRSLQMDGNAVKKQIASDLHSYTYGLTSDPLTQFAIVFGAMIHDCDHFGVSNGQLVKEGASIAEKYKNKSVAEQNSVDLAWDLLMDTEEYGDLQACIFPSDSEFKRFRQVVVNVVMATDIFDKELGELRKNRWAKAFHEDAMPDDDHENRKATIVIEHIMQAGDVGHTMQHWHVYQKWNRRLFDELYTSYRAGRMENDPALFWYEGELKFFDFYIIPLAKKLKECNVFGVASDECLNYAQQNRLEWESKGQKIVEELVSNFLKREQEDVPPAVDGKRGRKQRFARRRSLVTTGG